MIWKKLKEKRKHASDSVILERPIENEKEDCFGILPYVNQLLIAIKKGARFIAIDGDYGSGKSSLINILKKKLKKKGNRFVIINSLNTTTTEDYHRYFINQVANDLMIDPYEIEKIFYRKTFSYTTIKPDTQKTWKKVIDKFLLLTLGLLCANGIASVILKNMIKVFNLEFIFNKITPICLIISFVLILIYGFGFTKPEDEKESPLLDVDKNRNNFLKILENKIPGGSTIFLIIDDLDRINNKDLQKEIISLLYNEYYPLDKHTKNIKIKFIFMLNLKKLKFETKNDDEKSGNYLDENKVFDYKLSISNNQSEILETYLNDYIETNSILNRIFNNIKIEEKKYFIGIILKEYKCLRNIKHFLNKIITKLNYIEQKNIPDFKISYEQLISLCILDDVTKDKDKFNNILQSCIDKDDLSEYSDFKYLDEFSKYIDGNSYIYIYNFKDSRNLFNLSELNIINMFEKKISSEDLEELNKYNKFMESSHIRYKVIYNKIYTFQDSKTKLFMLCNKNFSDYLKQNELGQIEWIDIKNIYRNKILNSFLPNIIDGIKREDVILDMLALKTTFDNEKDNLELASQYSNELKIFIENAKESILFFDLKELFENLILDNEILKLLEKINFESYNLIQYLYLKEIITFEQIAEFINVSKINEFRKKTDQKKEIEFEERILKENINKDLFIDLINNENNKFQDFYSISTLRPLFNELNIDELILVITKFEYNIILDESIIKNISNEISRIKFYNFINIKKINLSINILTTINTTYNDFYSFNSYYVELFKKYNLIEAQIRTAESANQIISLNQYDYLKNDYKLAIINIFLKITENNIKMHNFSSSCLKIIINNFNWSTINKENIWRLIYLDPYIDFNNFEKIINSITNQDVIDTICYLYIKNSIHDLKKLSFLRTKCSVSATKRLLTTTITKINL